MPTNPPKKSVKDLFDDAATKVLEARKIQETADEAKREITKEEDEKITNLLQESDRIHADATRRHQIESRQGYVDTPIPMSSTPEYAPGVDITRNKEKVYAEAKDPKVEAMGGFPSAGHFFTAVRNAGDPSVLRHDPRLYAAVGSDEANTRTGATGGFLVPTAISQQIWDGAAATPDNLLALTDQYTLGQEESITFPAVDETTQAAGVAGGGVTAYRRAELAQMAGSRPKFREITLKPEEMYVMCYVTERLLAGSPLPLEQFLTRKAIDAIASLTSDEIIAGVGGGSCLGIMNAGCAVEVAKETGQLADTVVYENVLKMWSRCLAGSRDNAVWLINQEVEPQLQQMSIGVGTAGTPVYLPAGGISGQPYGSIFGRPVRSIRACKKLGDKGDIILANLGWYASAVKGTPQGAISTHIRFDYAQVAFRWTFMVDGRPWLAAAITPQNATSGNTLSPFVTLAARA